MVQAVLGIDVGKHKLQVALLLPGKKPKPKVVTNTPEGHQTLLQWLNQTGVNQVHACLEATNTYGEAVAPELPALSSVEG